MTTPSQPPCNHGAYWGGIIPGLSAEILVVEDRSVPWLPPATVYQSACLLCGARTPYMPESAQAHTDAADHYLDFHETEETA